MTNYIFVYGILKRGEQGHNLLVGCKFVGIGRVRGCILLNLGGCPGMIPGKVNHANDVMGEIYYVPNKRLSAILEQLDRVEHVGEQYLRARIQVELIGNGRAECDGCILECITYLYMPVFSTNIIIPGGNWSQAERGHGRQASQVNYRANGGP